MLTEEQAHKSPFNFNRFDFTSKRDSQYGMCYTFNHKNMSQYYTVGRSGETTGFQLSLLLSQIIKLFLLRSETSAIQSARRISFNRDLRGSQNVCPRPKRPDFLWSQRIYVVPGADLLNRIAESSQMSLISKLILIKFQIVLKAMEIRLNTPNDLCVEDASEVQFYNFNNSSYFQEVGHCQYIITNISEYTAYDFPTGLHKQLYSNSNRFELQLQFSNSTG